MANPFYGPLLKVRRANHHINELEQLFSDYKEKHPKGIKKYIDPQTGYEIQKVGGEFAEHTPTVMGDAIHNLRSSLDLAFCILVTANGHNINRYTSFPFRDSETDLKGALKGIRKAKGAPSEEVEDILLHEIKPYKGSKLYGLHDVDIADKHRTLLPTISRVEARSMRIGTGEISNSVFESLANHNPGEFGGSAIMTMGPPGHPNNEIHGDFSGEIVFPYGTPFAGQSIISTLKELLELVAGVHVRLQHFAK